MRTKTYLPIFTGFYESIFDLDPNEVLYENESLTYDDLTIDYQSYNIEVSKQLCNVIADKLSDFVHDIKFERLVSPKYYNFSNDSIDVLIDYNKQAIQEYIYENQEAFEKYLKQNYTSCDGFISSFSNSFEEWEKLTKKFKNFRADAHLLGSILQFISENEEITECDLYSEVMEGVDTLKYIDYESNI